MDYLNIFMSQSKISNFFLKRKEPEPSLSSEKEDISQLTFNKKVCLSTDHSSSLKELTLIKMPSIQVNELK